MGNNSLLVIIIYALYRSLPAGLAAESREHAERNTTSTISLLETVLQRVDNRVRPNSNEGPLKVKCDFYIQSISSINEVDMDYQIDVYFRQRWHDRHLLFSNLSDPIVVPAAYVDQFWIPDIFFPNEKSASFHNVVVPNKVIKIFQNGLVRYSARLSLVLACPMHLLHYPLDYQNCYIKVSSYTYSSKDIILEWLNNEPIEINTHLLSLPQFKYLGYTLSPCEESYKTGEFPCIMTVFHFKRSVGYYVLQSFVPSILIVVLSWLSFWIDKHAAPARITLGVTSVLTMTTQLSSSRSIHTKMSYPTAIDVWYTFCMILVFGALCEYALVNVLSVAEKAALRAVQEAEQTKREEEEQGETRPRLPFDRSQDTIVELSDAGCSSVTTKTTDKQEPLAVRFRRQVSLRYAALRSMADPVTRHFSLSLITADGLDKTSRIIFPLAFLLFNISFWIVYSQPVVFFSHLFDEN